MDTSVIFVSKLLVRSNYRVVEVVLRLDQKGSVILSSEKLATLGMCVILFLSQKGHFSYFFRISYFLVISVLNIEKFSRHCIVHSLAFLC